MVEFQVKCQRVDACNDGVTIERVMTAVALGLAVLVVLLTGFFLLFTVG